MDVADLRPLPLFDGVSDDQLAELLGDGSAFPFGRGDVVFREGEHADFWWVLVEGSVALSRRLGGEEVTVGSMAVPGVWSGGFRAWDEQGTYLATGRGETPGRLLRVPAEALRDRLRAWLPLGVHLINGVYGTARRIEATARQRDSLVALGRLSAGLAHELNNPAAAAVRAVAALEDTSGALLGSLRGLAEQGISAAQFAALDALRLELVRPSGPGDPLVLADREDALTDWLEEHDVDRAWELAPVLAAAGAEPVWCDRVDQALEAGLQPAIEWVAATLSSTTLIGEVRESTRRISALVSAVRSYSQMDRGSRQSIDVTVVRDYAPDLPPVDAFPGELNQVWTNLVDNALDAMEGSGTLRVRTRLDGDRVVVEVGDTGPGMAPEVAARAFEAFFTTKDIGEGTGLGLDIARRIVVDRHHGEIVLHPDPGDNVVEVRLPITHQD